MDLDHEHLLICKIVEERTIAPVIEAQVQSKHFLDDEHRKVFDFILDHKQRYGNVPAVKVVKASFPGYALKKSPETFDFLIDKIREVHTLALMERGLEIATEAYDDGNIEAGKSALARTLAEIEQDVPSLRDLNLAETGAERLARYLALREIPEGLRGIPTGFNSIDRATQGLQTGQLLTFVGPPKAGKSTLMLLTAMAAQLQGYRVLFVTFEMSNEEQAERFDSIRAGVSHSKLRGGTISTAEEKKLRRALKQTDNLPDFILSNDTAALTTLTGIATKIDTIKPDIVYVDGVYLMQDEHGERPGSPQALTNLTRGFKRLAQSRNIPIVISTQVLTWKMDRKKGITADSIGYSSSFIQDSDTVLGVESTDEADVQKLKIVMARHCPPMEVYLKWDWDTARFEEMKDDDFDDEDVTY